jgi:hypothetical protein
MTKPHVAVLVLNRNMREMTEKLITDIRYSCKGNYTLFGLEAASDKDKMAGDPRYSKTMPDVRVVFSENKRWAWSFATGMDIATKYEAYEDGRDVPPGMTFQSPQSTYWGETEIGEAWMEGSLPPFTHFWLLCNDTQLDPNCDTLGILLMNMPADACQIHPYQTTHPRGSPQGQHSQSFYDNKNKTEVHNVAFVEFVCPLITREFYDACLANFHCPPVNPDFAYGWGVDYEMAYFGHQLKKKSYICDAVGITHHPGTTHLNHEVTKVEDNNQMRVLARNNMLDVLEKKHGRDWGDKFANSARAAGVDPRAFLEWSSYDRSLSISGTRVS